MVNGMKMFGGTLIGLAFLAAIVVGIFDSFGSFAGATLATTSAIIAFVALLGGILIVVPKFEANFGSIGFLVSFGLLGIASGVVATLGFVAPFLTAILNPLEYLT